MLTTVLTAAALLPFAIEAKDASVSVKHLSKHPLKLLAPAHLRKHDLSVVTTEDMLQRREGIFHPIADVARSLWSLDDKPNYYYRRTDTDPGFIQFSFYEDEEGSANVCNPTHLVAELGIKAGTCVMAKDHHTGWVEGSFSVGLAKASSGRDHIHVESFDNGYCEGQAMRGKSRFSAMHFVPGQARETVLNERSRYNFGHGLTCFRIDYVEGELYTQAGSCIHYGDFIAHGGGPGGCGLGNHTYYGNFREDSCSQLGGAGPIQCRDFQGQGDDDYTGGADHPHDDDAWSAAIFHTLPNGHSIGMSTKYVGMHCQENAAATTMASCMREGIPRTHANPPHDDDGGGGDGSDVCPGACNAAGTGNFCNYDNGATGYCESCSHYTAAADCWSDGLPTAGASDCEAVCFGTP